MNNQQFRRLVLDTPSRQALSSSPSDGESQSTRNGATPALGSRLHSSIPMTPRSVAGSSYKTDFARQLAERNGSSQVPNKKFRSSAAPKGAKLAEGYVDRAKSRLSSDNDAQSDKAERIKSLEEMMKLDQIDETTFVRLRDEILGDDVGMERASLVKGLDWGLLQRVKRGEVGVADVLEPGRGKDEEEQEPKEDVDEAFDELESLEVEAIVKEKVKKKGEMAPPTLTGKKRTRDQILAEMKAAREAAKAAAQPSLGSKFKRVGERRDESRIEIDNKGREVMITIDEDGNEKRKVRRVQGQELVPEKKHELLMPDKDAQPLGMQVLEAPKVEEPTEDVDIFDEVGDDYDPLAALGDESSEEEGDEGEEASTSPALPMHGAMKPPPRPDLNGPRNYFGNSQTATSEATSRPKGLSDPTLLAALRKASTLNPVSKEVETAEERAKEERRKKMLQQDDRDAQDIDMGFGSSRFADEEDFEEKKVKLSEWKGQAGGDDDEEVSGKGDGKGKRKRGPKKRKGDVNSAADVLKVLAKRKSADA